MGLVFFLTSFFLTFMAELNGDVMVIGESEEDAGAKYRIAQWFMVFTIM
jgi:hypothetical protein